MVLNVDIKNGVATYKEGDELPICGNSGYTIKFTFDEEWSEHEAKTARFKWGGTHKDVEFTGDTCEVPVVENTQVLIVGVYAGELPEDGFMLSTTDTSINYRLSTRCGKTTANPTTGQNYTNEARGYAAEAKAAEIGARTAAAEAKEVAEDVSTYELKTLKNDINRLGHDIAVLENNDYMIDTTVLETRKTTLFEMPTKEITDTDGSTKIVRAYESTVKLVALYPHFTVSVYDYNTTDMVERGVVCKNFVKTVSVKNNSTGEIREVFSLSDELISLLAQYEMGLSRGTVDANYIYFGANGRVYYVQNVYIPTDKDFGLEVPLYRCYNCGEVGYNPYGTHESGKCVHNTGSGKSVIYRGVNQNTLTTPKYIDITDYCGEFCDYFEVIKSNESRNEEITHSILFETVAFPAVIYVGDTYVGNVTARKESCNVSFMYDAK